MIFVYLIIKSRDDSSNFRLDERLNVQKNKQKYHQANYVLYMTDPLSFKPRAQKRSTKSILTCICALFVLRNGR